MPNGTNDERAGGALWGLAYGDALGCPVEGWSAGEITHVYRRYALLTRYPLSAIASLGPERLRRLRPLGLHSDDTQQALALLSCCLEPGGWRLERWPEAIAEGAAVDAWRGTGERFRQACKRIAQGRPAEECGEPTVSLGAAMRVGPLGALLGARPERLRQVVAESTFLTHRDIRAAALAFATAHSVAKFVQAASPALVRETLPDAVAEFERYCLDSFDRWSLDAAVAHDVSTAIGRLLESGCERSREQRAAILDIAGSFGAGGHPAGVNANSVFLGGLAALAAGLTDTDNPARALLQVVRQGGDADTIAAIAGSLLGARFGLRWIPRRRLLDRHHLDAWNQAVATGRSPESLESLLARESRWTAYERGFRAGLRSFGAV